MVRINRDTRHRSWMPELYYQTCYWCRENFGIPYNVYRGKVQLGQTEFFCSKKCLLEYGFLRDAAIAYKRVTDQVPATRSQYAYTIRTLAADSRCRLNGHPRNMNKWGKCIDCIKLRAKPRSASSVPLNFKCEHGDTFRSDSGRCRACWRVSSAAYHVRNREKVLRRKTEKYYEEKQKSALFTYRQPESAA